MNNSVIKEFLFSLAWIQSSKNIANYYEVVLALKDLLCDDDLKYIAFSFTSIDTMFVCLRSLARNYNLYSIDALKKGFFPVKVEYSQNFISPDVFQKLYIKDEIIWPNENIHGHFKFDTHIF